MKPMGIMSLLTLHTTLFTRAFALYGSSLEERVAALESHEAAVVERVATLEAQLTALRQQQQQQYESLPSPANTTYAMRSHAASRPNARKKIFLWQLPSAMQW